MSTGVLSRIDYYRRNQEILKARSRDRNRQPAFKQKNRARNNARYHYIIQKIKTAFAQSSDDPESLFYRGAEE